MRIALIAKPGHEDTGIGRYTAQLQKTFEEMGHEVLVVHPTIPLPAGLLRIVKQFLGWDLKAFFANYPVWIRYPQADIYHLVGQNLAIIMILKKPPGKTVVTVHDIIPWLVRDDMELRVYRHLIEKWFDWLAIASLKHTDLLIADSVSTKNSLRQVQLRNTK